MTHSKRRHPAVENVPGDSLAYSLLEAAHLVECVLNGQNLTEAFERQLRDHVAWSDATRGAVRDLAWRCLRDYGRGDAILERLLTKPLPPKVHALLLVALSRLASRPEQKHLIVDQTVSAVGTFAPGLKAVANGVLRNSLRQADELETTLAQNPEARYYHPAWWIQRCRKDWPDDWEAVLAAASTKPPMALRVNRRVTSVETQIAALEEAGISVCQLANGALLLERPVAVTRLPGFSEGRLSVQDAGAQWAAQFLDLAAGQNVLDACAAPGGKAAHILETEAVSLLALEMNAGRTDRIKDNMDRLGLNANIQVGDARELATWWNGKLFDRILADVPCSASGVVRRHPDIKWLRRSEDIGSFARQQREILDALWQTLLPGGKMLYVTCSIFREENHHQMASFCARHPDAVRLMLAGQSDFQLLPTAEHDGFYYGLLQKRA